jgi:hypothetical protein
MKKISLGKEVLIACHASGILAGELSLKIFFYTKSKHIFEKIPY